MSESLVSGREKRRKLDKHGRSAALERFKDLKNKGSKNKIDLSIDNVYDEVDEREYGKKVLERADDWIVDDDGSGYVEDGRDIFDDDLDDESINKNAKNAGKSKKRSHSGKMLDQDGKSGSSNIRNMLMNMPIKKKEVNVKLDDDDVLGDIMSELNSEANVASYNDSVKPSRSMSPTAYLRSMRMEMAVPKRRCEPTKENIVKKSIVEVEPMDIDSQVIEEFNTQENCEKVDTPDPCDINDAKDVNWEIEEFDSEDLMKGIESAAEAAEKQSTTDAPSKPVVETPKEESLNAELANSFLLTPWELMQSQSTQSTDSESPAAANFDRTKLPLTTNENGEMVLRMFWLDAYEDVFKQPGTVYLFGKVWVPSLKTHVSCCVSIKNIDRRIYVLPRERVFDKEKNVTTDQLVTMGDVYKEFNSVVAKQYKIHQFKSRTVTKNYSFNIPGVPASSEYLEVRYPASCSRLPSTLSGSTFSRIFGAPTNSLEIFLLEKRLKGPCWLDITNVASVSNHISWCKLEGTVSGQESVTVYSGKTIPPPPLVVLSWTMRTAINPNTCQHEIVMLGCLVHNEFHLDRPAPNPLFQQNFCIITTPSGVHWPLGYREKMSGYKSAKLIKIECERALLTLFITKLHNIDPDLIVAHDIMGFDFDVLIHRINANKVPLWSRLGRLRRAIAPAGRRGRDNFDKSLMSGRLACDIKISAKELIRCRSYDLGALCDTVLKIGEFDRKEVTTDQVRTCYRNTDEMLKMVSYTMQDSVYVLRLMYDLNVMPLSLQITNIAGNLLSRTLTGGRSERNEYLLLHAFTEKDYIVPDKEFKNSKDKTDHHEGDEDEKVTAGKDKKTSGRKKPAYTGGLVLEPKKGFYDKLVLLMDFNSLYPSIIQEYNICFTTVNIASLQDDDEPELPKSGCDAGILPIEIRKLVESRKSVKNLMKTPNLSAELKMQYNIRQLALKLTANSMYGCLGFSYSRFYAKPLAALVTAKGREILSNTRELVEKLNYDVIYGDTDSIMINTNCLDYGEVHKIGHKIKNEVNKLYRQVELDVDGVFKYMLLLKKKKYAAVTISQLPSGELVTAQEVKGLDIVRRDWCLLAAETGKYVLSQILSDLDHDQRLDSIHSYLIKLREDMDKQVVPLALFEITKQLTKHPEEYADLKSQAHVIVALRLNARYGNRLRMGDTVSYVICEDGTNWSAMLRAYHIRELNETPELKLDLQYYLKQQILPVIERLCDPIEGTDGARIAECLGLDPKEFRRQIHREEAKDMAFGEMSVLSSRERFRDCDKFTFLCKNEKCNKENVIDSPTRKTDSGDLQLVLEQCANPKCDVSPKQYISSILNSLTLSMRSYINRFYLNQLICEDPACPNTTRRFPIFCQNYFPVCTLCQKGVMYREYSDCELYTQLCYFQYVFDLSKISPVEKSTLKISAATEEAYATVKEHVEHLLKRSDFSVVKIDEIFDGLTDLHIKHEP